MHNNDRDRVAFPLFENEYNGERPVSAKQLNIGLVTSKTAAKYNNKWHSRMPYIGSFSMCSPCFSAEYNNIYYAVALWSLPIAANRLKDGFNCLELRRLAIAPDAPKFTATRMISIMVKWIKKNRPDIIKLISYQDTGVHTGTIYKASNWTAVKKSKFVSWSEHKERPGKLDQSDAPKIRWEYILKKGEDK